MNTNNDVAHIILKGIYPNTLLRPQLVSEIPHLSLRPSTERYRSLKATESHIQLRIHQFLIAFPVAHRPKQLEVEILCHGAIRKTEKSKSVKEVINHANSAFG